MGRLPDGGVVHVEVTADGPHDHLAGVEPHANLHGCAAAALDLVRVEVHPALHSQRGIAGADRVVLVPDRRSEQRHDPVAHHLVDGALVVMDGLHHPFEHRVEELPGLLGVAVGEELHRALEVGEEHGHLLALAFEGGLRGEDLLGEVLGGVGLGAGRAPGGFAAAGAAARATESLARREFSATLGTGQCEAAAAVLAEPQPVAVLSVAPGTRHGRGGSPPP